MAFATITGVVDYAKRGGKGYTVIKSWQVQGQDRKRRWAVWFEEETPLELQSTVTLSGVLGTKVGDEWDNQQGEKRPGGVEHTLNKARFVKGKDPELANSSPRGAQGQPQQGEPWAQSAPQGEPWSGGATDASTPF